MKNKFVGITNLVINSILIYCFVLCFNVNSIIAQIRLNDTTKYETNHLLKAKPKKIKKRRVVYKLQVKSICDALNLTNSQCDSLNEVYRIVRRDRKLELTKYTNKKNDNYKRTVDVINSKARENLKNTLKKFLTEDQINMALIALGSFNPKWDSYVNLVANFNLEIEKMKSALSCIYNYIVNYEQFKSSKGEKKKKVILKNKLDQKLKLILNNEQFELWDQQTNQNINN
ncbi:MAG: hypothetical protein QXF76_04560 [Candidatus Anstonellales archaeon]